MENAKLVERKEALEEALLANNQDREAIVEQMLKPAQKSLSEIQADHAALDGRYAELCDLLDTDPSVEFAAFIKRRQEKAAADAEAKKGEDKGKEIPAEKPAETKK